MNPGVGWHRRRHVPVPDALRRPVGADRPDAPCPHRPAGLAVHRCPHDARIHHLPVQVLGSPGGICPRSTGHGREVWTWHRRMAEQGTWDTVLATLAPCSGCRRPDRLVGLGGLHDRPRTSAREEHHPAHRGWIELQGIRMKSPPITASGAPGAEHEDPSARGRGRAAAAQPDHPWPSRRLVHACKRP